MREAEDGVADEGDENREEDEGDVPADPVNGKADDGSKNGGHQVDQT